MNGTVRKKVLSKSSTPLVKVFYIFSALFCDHKSYCCLPFLHQWFWYFFKNIFFVFLLSSSNLKELLDPQFYTVVRSLWTLLLERLLLVQAALLCFIILNWTNKLIFFSRQSQRQSLACISLPMENIWLLVRVVINLQFWSSTLVTKNWFKNWKGTNMEFVLFSSRRTWNFLFQSVLV